MFGMGKGGPKPQSAAARKPAPRQPALVPVTVKLEPRQRDVLASLGGDAWLREQLDKAAAASAFSA